MIKIKKIDELKPKIKELYWQVPLLWPNSTFFIIGGGPSIKKLDLTKIQGRWPVIVCNMGFLDFPWANVMYFGDCKVYDWLKKNYKKRWSMFKGIKVSCCSATKDDPDIHCLYRISKGITQDTRAIGWNVNTGGSAINLAYHFGAKKVILLGFDMQQVNGRSNFHNYNIVKDSDPENIYKKMIRHFKAIYEDTIKLNIEVINATKESKLPYFPIKSYKQILKEIA